MMKKIYFPSAILFILWMLPFAVVHAQPFHGSVQNGQTGLPLADVSILTPNGKHLAKTNNVGQFSIDADATQLDVVCFLHGYRQQKVRLRAGVSSKVALMPLEEELEKVTVTAYREKRGNNVFQYDASDVKKITTVLGETDVMRYMQVLPGISQGIEGGMGFYVRGAGNGNNRVVLDDVPIIAPTHLFGLFSTFHPDIVQKSTFQMGGISAASGDFLSSLLQVETQTPDAQKYSGSVSLSPLMLGASLQGYLVKDKLSFQSAARTSLLRAGYLLTQKTAGEENVSGDFNPQVQDLYTKLHWNIHPQHSVMPWFMAATTIFSMSPKEKTMPLKTRLRLGGITG